MKKLIGMVAAIAMSVTCLTACGNSEDDFVGKWECKEMKTEGMTITDDFMGIPVAAMFQIEFKDDKTGTAMTMGEASEDFEWTADGDTLSAEIDGDTTKFKKDGDTITISEDMDGSEATIKLKKVDEFTEFDASSFDE